jgi:hypothetical protein
MKRPLPILIGALVFLAVLWLAAPLGGVRSRVEKIHGICIPPTAEHIQTCHFGGLLALDPFDKGALCMFEISEASLPTFLSQLSVRSTRLPDAGVGDPCVNGRNVWPAASTFVPGNSSLACLKKTWRGDAKPIKMLSCDSKTGDWLHVEIWEVTDHLLIKLYTDWN